MARRYLCSVATGLAVLMVFFLLGPDALGQVNTTTAEIVGTVHDEHGLGLPGVAVEGVNVDNGLRRTAFTDASGRYLLTLLPPGRYAVTAILEGFSIAKRDGLVLTLGSSSRVDLTLRLAAVTETVIVTGEASVIDETKTEVSSTVTQNAIKNLPLQTRNFTDLVILTPGATGDDSGRVHLSGQRGIANSFNVDGADSNSTFFGEQRGGTRPPFTFSQGAIQEFQVVTSSYNAQYGNATGGVINAVTKSGTNDYHADVFGFYRAKSLQQRDANAFIGDGFEQKQFGGFIGGPVVRDQLFFFGGYDAQRLNDPFEAAYANRGTSTDPLLNPANVAKLTQWGIDPTTEWGTVNQTNNVDSPFIKLSWNASDRVTVSIRDNYNKQQGENLTNGRQFPDDGISNNGLESNFFNSLVGNAHWVGSAELSNELIGQAATEHRPRKANSVTLPETVISNFGRFGQNNFLPNNLDETRLQFTDNVTFYSGSNTIKAGADYAHIKYSDEFYRYRFGVYNYSSLANFPSTVRTFRQDFSNYGGLVDYSSDFVTGYIQDEWRPSSRLTVNLGIRYDYQRQPNSQDLNPLYPSVQSIPSDTNNWAPRLGFAWDPTGSGRSVVRGGVGSFYVYSPSLLTANALLNNGIRVLDFNITCNSTGSNCPTYPSIFTQAPTAGQTKSNIFVFDRNFQNTITQRVSLGWEHEVAKDFAVGVDAIYARTTQLERVKDLNLAIVGTTPDGRTKYSTSSRPNPNYGAIQQFTSDGNGEYKGLLFSVRKRFSRGFQFMASYAYGDSRDNQSNERSVSLSANSPEDANNLNNDYGYSDFDVRHAVVLSGVFTLPFGFTVSPLYRWRTGVPYTPGNSVDVNGDGIFNDRANDLINCDANGACDLGPNHVQRNSARQPNSQSLDMTLSKEFGDLFSSGVGASIYVQVFNLAHSSNRSVSTGSTGNNVQVLSAGTVGGVQKYKLNPNYGVPDLVGPPRQFQLGVRLSM